jgi:hypothetical protein
MSPFLLQYRYEVDLIQIAVQYGPELDPEERGSKRNMRKLRVL